MFQRIFIDATYTLASGKNSGIERVVRSLWRESDELAKTGVIPTPRQVVSIDGKFYAPNAEQLASFSRPAAMHANVLSMLPPIYQQTAQAVCRLTGSSKLRKWMLPQAGHLGWFKLAHNVFESRVRREITATCQPVEFSAGDLVLLPDAYWVNRLRGSVWPAAQQARARGGLIATLMYDLIPLTHSHFVGHKRRDAFLDYLKQAAQNSDLLLAISQTVRDQVASFLPTIAESDSGYCENIRAFQLGAELNNEQGEVRASVQALFSTATPPYLMVATFDPRKNHEYLMDAFELLWETRPDLKLCLVGRIGSRCDAIVKRVVNHPRLGKSLFLFSDLSDAELHHCYAGARGVIFPSIVEGFGLPIVESLWFGKRTFVSDTPIHREVGLDDCCYFNLQSPASLVDELLAWEQVLLENPQTVLPIRKPVTWRESTQQVLDHCCQTARNVADDRYRQVSAARRNAA
jgi:glycosyltransferase involved in cell wall biosynthesis